MHRMPCTAKKINFKKCNFNTKITFSPRLISIECAQSRCKNTQIFLKQWVVYSTVTVGLYDNFSASINYLNIWTLWTVWTQLYEEHLDSVDSTIWGTSGHCGQCGLNYMRNIWTPWTVWTQLYEEHLDIVDSVDSTIWGTSGDGVVVEHMDVQYLSPNIRYSLFTWAWRQCSWWTCTYSSLNISASWPYLSLNVITIIYLSLETA